MSFRDFGWFVEKLSMIWHRLKNVLTCTLIKIWAGLLRPRSKNILFLSILISFSLLSAFNSVSEFFKRKPKKLVAIVAMDLSKAFDSLPHSLLISKLRAYGLDNSSCAFLQNYLTGRFQRVKVGDEVSCWELNRRGVAQGSVLGPLCFNVFLNDLSYFI